MKQCNPLIISFIVLLSVILLRPMGPAQAEEGKPYSAWLVYWDGDASLADAVTYEHDFDQLIYFAALFNEDDSLFYPPELTEMHTRLDLFMGEGRKPSYLSIVNDYTLPGGTYSLKDVDLLRRLLLQGEERIGQLSDEILRLAVSQGYDGVEIDFEGILSHLDIWEGLFAFVDDLYAKSTAMGMRMRVLLEPRTPFDSLTFPKGPEYVMMCYNLFGNHSGPGPKANQAFLVEMASKMSAIPATDRSFALAMGGFDWSQGTVSQLTTKQAQELLEERGAELFRQEEVANFRYIDDDGMEHEVWYADDQTLRFWTGVLNDMGETSIDLWRLGGIFTR